ncbi:MAG: hypothetical protein ABL897_07970 [Hyphomicrobium sp.]
MSVSKKAPPRSADEVGANDAGDDHECAGHAGGFPLRKDFGFTPIEDVTLELLRCVGQLYGTGDAGYWHTALDHADRRLGQSDGPVLVARVTALLRAIRAERNGGFTFLSPGCSHICDDEVAVMTAVKAARQGDSETMRHVACHVARGHEVHKIETAARLLAREQARFRKPDAGHEPSARDGDDAMPSTTLH